MVERHLDDLDQQRSVEHHKYPGRAAGGQRVGLVFARRARVMGIVARAATSIGVSAPHPSANRCLVLIRMGKVNPELVGAARHTHSRDCLRCGDR